MIDKNFWKRVAENWRKDDDGISIPKISTEGIELIDPSTAFLDLSKDEEIDDILSEMGFDDI